jgi:hypothetical protein
MSGDDTAQPLEYYVLKDGETFGPFDEDQLRAGLAEGHFSAGDFVQTSNQTTWQPIGHLLDPTFDETEGAVAPNWSCILKWAWRRLRYSLDEGSVQAGGVCLAIGTATLLLSSWPFLFWIPWFVATAIAGVALIRRKREAHGTVLLMCVVCVPILYAIHGRKEPVLPRPEKEIATAPSKPETAPSPFGTPITATAPVQEPPPVPDASPAQASPAPETSPIPGLVEGQGGEAPAPR